MTEGGERGPCTELVHDLQSLWGVYIDGEMDVWVRNEAWEAERGELCVSASVWGGEEVTTYSHPWALPF